MNKFEERSKQSYDKIATEYDNSPEGRFTIKFKQMLLACISMPAGGALLDVACGTGSFLKQLTKKQTFLGYGVDISPKMIDCARAQNPSMQFVEAFCENLPFEDSFFILLLTV